MPPHRVLLLALITQGALILAGWILSRLIGHQPTLGEPLRDIPIGIAAALLFAAINYAMFFRAPHNWLVDGVRAVYDRVLVPLFAGLGPLSNVAIGIAAGVGEEWLFRGALQPVLGIGVTSVLFGLAHVGGRHMVAFGVWATGMGLALGTLAWATGGLLAPVVAHSLYDILALEFIRRGAHKA
jgi:membrane protease YdiL (CAAX protease family)